MVRRQACTGVAARWCPIHGDCTCRGTTTLNGHPGEYPDLNDDDCPLHSRRSDHATPAAVT